MTYYRVKPEYDNAILYKPSTTTHSYVSAGVLIGNELYTPVEKMKLCSNACFVRDYSGRRTYILNTEAPCFEKVNISKNRTYRMFGARFEMED